MAMRNAEHPVEWPEDVRTVGAMLGGAVDVRAICSKCGSWKHVDLRRVAELKGLDFSLINRDGRCTMLDHCSGSVRFYYARADLAPLFTPDQSVRWELDRRQRWLPI